MKGDENITTRRYTREKKGVSVVIEDKSAVRNHADRNNCIIDGEGAKVIGRERTETQDGSKRSYGSERQL